MSSSKSTIDYVLEQTKTAGFMSARKMFGDYALYCNGRVVGLVCDDTLFIKITGPGKEFVGEHYQEGYAYKGARVSMMIDGDRLEDREWISQLIRITADNVSLPKSKK